MTIPGQRGLERIFQEEMVDQESWCQEGREVREMKANESGQITQASRVHGLRSFLTTSPVNRWAQPAVTG